MSELEKIHKCELCREKDADKTNTHYLTDAIIRSCFNYEGAKKSNRRENGAFYDVSNNNYSMRFGFQRNTPVEIIERGLGRESTEEENEEAMRIPFSVDYVFCSDCEELFGKIEKPFIDTILPAFKDSKRKQQEIIEINDIKAVRLFFVLQFWRCHVSNTNLRLKDETAESFREMIQKYDNCDLNVLKQFPMSVSYLDCSESMNHTNHFVGTSSIKNPYVIFMNDFIIQLFDSKDDLSYYPLFGVNKEDTFLDYINYKEGSFKVKIIQENEWEQIVLNYYKLEKIPHIEVLFIMACCRLIHHAPNENEIKEFLLFFEKSRKTLMFTEEMLNRMIVQFVNEKYKNHLLFIPFSLRKAGVNNLVFLGM